MSGSIRQRLEADLLPSMKAKDTVRTAVIRTALAALANAEAVDRSQYDRRVIEVDRKVLTEDDCRAIIATELAEIDAAVVELREHGQAVDAEELHRRSEILRSYLSE